ncbi:MAG: rhodanese-like domain-containing protein [Candidatus Thiodiazotropha sp. (ex Semelilucina semeliformis)]|nr:rhodanese-like domain-containing protein [Candidatus Thiodiazotropha sp. (ex Myrtea spinifera)]MCU7808890.1 rhodanese-like domain-containing protein [Candidatus Thiodiazotropha sp. (ex Semelilucina semeliformis)]MCU7827966.1 rhodanese-like domain-containing protein [Candidatus Thiodiazotropha sp. (ex Myrtea sp. 'scaly one' KF741663)]
MKPGVSLYLSLALLALAFQSGAEELVVGGSDVIGLTADKPYLHVIHEGRSVKVQRVQDPDYELKGYFAKTARKCPPFCIQPEQVDPRVSTVGEIEIFNFMENELRDNKGIMIDARTPEWFQRGTIPGSINIPFTQFGDGNSPEMEKTLQLFGAKRRVDVSAMSRKLEEMGFMDGERKTEKWDFSNAKKLVVWCNGPACGQSPRAIKGLLKVGYPTDSVFYYRGGMQMWQLWGLTTVIPGE